MEPEWMPLGTTSNIEINTRTGEQRRITMPLIIKEWREKLTPKQNEASNTTHKELCDQALKHYQEISDKACHFNSIVPKAIEFYKNMPQNLPQECLKSCCKLAYSAGWWAGIDKYKLTHHPQH